MKHDVEWVVWVEMRESAVAKIPRQVWLSCTCSQYANKWLSLSLSRLPHHTATTPHHVNQPHLYLPHPTQSLLPYFVVAHISLIKIPPRNLCHLPNIDPSDEQQIPPRC